MALADLPFERRSLSECTHGEEGSMSTREEMMRC